MRALGFRDTQRAPDGYTLVELVVVLSLSATVGVMLFGVLMFSVTFMRRGASELETEQPFCSVCSTTASRRSVL